MQSTAEFLSSRNQRTVLDSNEESLKYARASQTCTDPRKWSRHPRKDLKNPVWEPVERSSTMEKL